MNLIIMHLDRETNEAPCQKQEEAMIDLKPCPFCGQNDWRVSYVHASSVISCGNCTAEATDDRWNDRPVEDALRSEVEALKAEVARLQPKPFTLTVEIPDLDTDGTCSGICPFWDYRNGCSLRLYTEIESDIPGPGCPRHKKEGE